MKKLITSLGMLLFAIFAASLMDTAIILFSATFAGAVCGMIIVPIVIILFKLHVLWYAIAAVFLYYLITDGYWFVRNELNPTWHLKSHLKFRKDGSVDWDPYSRKPGHVDYNNERLKIEIARFEGKTCLMTNLNTASWEELERDGYLISSVPKDEYGHRHQVRW